MPEKIVFLGTGDSMGVPRIYCDCVVCTEARNNGENRRYRSSILLFTEEGELLIDCGPDWKAQMERLKIREMKHVLITHAHFDHIGGLPEWADACRWIGKKGNVYAPIDVILSIKNQFPWLEHHLNYHDIGHNFNLKGWAITPFKVCHGKNGFSYAYRFTNQQFSWVYCPDSINLQENEKAFLYNLQLLILGTSFYREDAAMKTRSIYDMVEAMQLIHEVNPVRVIFTHMSHGVDITKPYPLLSNVTLAKTGMESPL